MFKKEERLSKDKDFDYVFKKGKSNFSEILGIKAAPNNMDKNRFGVLVGLKISKKAVVRNRVKRRLREAIENKSAYLKKGFDIVIITRSPIKDKEVQDMESALEKGFEKLSLFKK